MLSKKMTRDRRKREGWRKANAYTVTPTKASGILHLLRKIILSFV